MIIKQEHLDFILVRQKDKLLIQIKNARTKEDLAAILKTLYVTKELWIRADYEYKYKEIKQLVKQKQEKLKKDIKP